jgi:regulator of sirC expression with transglutaminase-like and TPR domain
VSAQAALASATFAPDPSSKIGQALQDPIVQAITAKTNAAVTDAYTKAQASYKEALTAYKQIAALSPKDPTTQLELAQAAEAASDATTAIAAYQAFLKLAPDDPSAPQVKQRIKQLQTPQPSAGSTG